MKAMGCLRRAFPGALACALLTATVLADVQEDIRDIRGPKALPAWPWIMMALGGGVIGLSIYAAYALRRRRRAAGHSALSLAEQALDRLENARPLMKPDTAREFGISASEVIRHYIEKRFDVRATQRTTEEFLQAHLLGANDALSRHRPLLASFLQQCDLVKFAGASVTTADLEAIFESARRFVLETRELA
jgi:hypothetical protein